MTKRKTISLTIGFLLGGALVTMAQETFSYRAGSNEVILLSEGQGDGDVSILIDAPESAMDKYVPSGTYPTAVNAFLVKRHGRNILIDAGYGRYLEQNLSRAGLEPEEVHEILLTHMHGDHIGGLLKEGTKVFPNAKLVLGRTEHDYWMSDEHMNAVPENKRGNFIQAREVITKYGANLEIVDPLDLTAIPTQCGIYPVALYGHTPGHIGFMVVCGRYRLLVWGDLTHAMAIQMPEPEIAVTYDIDPERAVETRLAVLAFVAGNDIPVAGMHVPYPGIGVVSVEGPGYRFTPFE